MTILETKNLRKNYSSFSLCDINLSINGGEITALVGENGAGKSTTIGCISSIIKKKLEEESSLKTKIFLFLHHKKESA